MSIRRLVRLVFLPALLHAGLLTSGAQAADQPLFPREGNAAVHQRILDVIQPNVVMVIALQPGYEDLRLMAYLRAFQGVRTTVVFLTNGEATPGDTLSQYPVWMTGERKAEAHRVARFLDAEARFVNVPDLAAPPNGRELLAAWESAGAQRRLVQFIRAAQPDVIVLAPDRRGPEGHTTIRDSVALTLVQRATDFAATQRDTSLHQGLLPWRVRQLVVQRPTGSTTLAFRERHPLTSRTPSAMAEQASFLYRTLRTSMPEWLDGGAVYHPVVQGRVTAAAVAPGPALMGGADPGPHLTGVVRSGRAVFTTDRRGVRSANLQGVSGLIDEAERVIIMQAKELDRRERRIAIAWKEGLEDLRCLVRGVHIEAVASESLLTNSQIMFLDVHPDPGTPKRGQTVIMFPLAANGEWTVNEKIGYFFPLDSISRFNILTPAEVQYTIPSSEFGLTQSQMDVVFPFIVVHKDAHHERNYMYHREIRLQFGPRRTFALHTPLVFDDPASPVIVELQNISRDKFYGDLALSDTTGDPSHAEVILTRKDEKILDTLLVPGDPALRTGGRALLLELSGRGGRRSVTTRAFRALADTSIHVHLLTTVSGTSLQEALRVIGQPWTPLASDGSLQTVPVNDVLLIDRASLSDPATTRPMHDALGAWVRKGGHAIVFPQTGSGAAWLRALCGATFGRMEPIAPTAPVVTPWGGALAAPNAIGAEDWANWVEMRAGYRIVMDRTDARTTLAAAQGNVPLITTVPVDAGQLTLVAADMQSQFMNYHPGVHRLLADLIALRVRTGQ